MITHETPVTRGASLVSKHREDFVKSLVATPPAMTSTRSAQQEISLEEQLFNSLAAFKITASHISMHLPRGGRDKLFEQMDELLSAEDWSSEDDPVNASSLRTFLRAYLELKPATFGELGVANNGRLVVAWFRGKNRLTMIFEPKDRIIYTISTNDQEGGERVSGETSVWRIAEVLRPFEPNRWFLGTW